MGRSVDACPGGTLPFTPTSSSVSDSTVSVMTSSPGKRSTAEASATGGRGAVIGVDFLEPCAATLGGRKETIGYRDGVRTGQVRAKYRQVGGLLGSPSSTVYSESNLELDP